jgi:hypothetical protein
VITKKWVDGKLEALRRTEDALDKELVTIKQQVGYRKIQVSEMISRGWTFINREKDYYIKPEISVMEMLDAICAHLGIEIVKEQKAETVVARKIKKVK